jgi:hypothetical protein
MRSSPDATPRRTSTMIAGAIPEPPADAALMLIDFQADFG